MCKTVQTPALLYKCEPESWMLTYSISMRYIIGYSTMVLFSFSFLALPIGIVGIFIALLLDAKIISTIIFATLMSSFCIKSTEWIGVRKFGQFWYELLDFHSNLSPAECQQFLNEGEKQSYICAMHPHGVVPFTGVLYAAYCDQYFTSTNNQTLYGFGAAANIVLYLPFLRNIMGWLSVSSADYTSMKKRLMNSELYSNQFHKNTKHVFLLPGGIAEIYTSAPKKHIVVFKRRKGLCKLSLETGAQIIPVYVFGATDFFENLVGGDNFIAKIARKLRVGLTLFYGPYFLPIPHIPKITFCYGKPLSVQKWDTSKGPIPEEVISALHQEVIYSLARINVLLYSTSC
jgi:hypothetical protein